MKRDSTKIGVGIIGASPNRGWALAAHIPALQALPDYEICAVSTSRRESAEKSAQALGVALAFDHHADLIARPEIDLVLVAVQVAHHNELAKTALTAGKMVYCEWPLGRNLKESEEIASLAQQKGLKRVIGLQGRFAPAVMYLRDLVADGYVGKLLGTHMVGSSPDAWGGTVEAAIASLADVRNGATLLAIPAGHALEMLCFALGEFVDTSSTLIARRGQTVTLPDNVTIPMTTPDQIAFSGTLENGALASVRYHGGASKGPDFVWEINGTDGDIILTLEEGYANISELKIQGAQGKGVLELLTVPDKYRLAPAGIAEAAVNVAALYVQFARDLLEGTTLAPDFDAAVRRHRLIDAIERSNTTGQRQTL